jgi:hypothetical protein
MATLVVGNGNKLATDATSVLSSARFGAVFGYNNTIQKGSYSTLTSGRDNIVSADNSLVVGQSNTVEGAAVGSRAIISAAIGGMNHVMAGNSWTMGSSNEVTGELSTALGVGLVADSMGCTFVGDTSAPVQGSLTTRRDEDPVFVVGNGTDSDNRSNALIVKRNGDVVITKPQGNISMGIYGGSN